jgi:hypothetical protein
MYLQALKKIGLAVASQQCGRDIVYRLYRQTWRYDENHLTNFAAYSVVFTMRMSGTYQEREKKREEGLRALL